MSEEQSNKGVRTLLGFDPAISGNEFWEAKVPEAGEVVYEPIPAWQLKAINVGSRDAAEEEK